VFTADGFYRTVDIVREIRREGHSYYRLEDRVKRLINRGGEKINKGKPEAGDRRYSRRTCRRRRRGGPRQRRCSFASTVIRAIGMGRNSL